MAILQNGPNGPIVGKFGSVNAYLLNGQNIIRGGKRKRTSPPSEAELLNREKQKIAGKFAAWNKRILEETLELDEENKPFVNLEKLLLFSGPLTPLANCQVSLDGDQIDLSWTVDDQYKSSIYKINLGLISLDAESHLRTSIANVNQGTCSLQFEEISRKTGDLHVYVGVWDTLEGDFSNSIYCGVI